MNRPSILVAVAVLFSTGVMAVAADSDSPRQSNLSIVKLLFVDLEPPTGLAANGSGGSPKMVRAGHSMIPVSALRTAKIYLDDEFVSDAMFGLVSAEPKFHVPSGVHSFRIECKGCKPFKSDIKVLGGGCEQYLFVILQPGKEAPVSAKQ